MLSAMPTLDEIDARLMLYTPRLRMLMPRCLIFRHF